MILNWGDGSKFLDGTSMSFLGVEDYAVLGNVVLVQVFDDDSVADVVTVLLSALTVSVNDPIASAEFVRVDIPMVVLVVEGAGATDIALAAIRMMVHAVESAGVSDAASLYLPLVVLVTDTDVSVEAVSVELGTLFPILINIAETGLTPEEWVQRFIGIIAIVTSDVIPIEERRLVLLRGFEDLRFAEAQLLQTIMTDEALVE